MLMPSRNPRNEPSLNDYNYYDHELVTQEDGKIARFSWCNKEKEKGWQFSNWEDAQGFHIVDENTNAKFLIQILNSKSNSRFGAYEFKIDDDEEIHNYEYGGILSKRGGVFITKKNNPFKIIKYQGLWMS